MGTPHRESRSRKPLIGSLARAVTHPRSGTNEPPVLRRKIPEPRASKWMFEQWRYFRYIIKINKEIRRTPNRVERSSGAFFLHLT